MFKKKLDGLDPRVPIALGEVDGSANPGAPTGKPGGPGGARKQVDNDAVCVKVDPLFSPIRLITANGK
jgi:hypothetical protein